MTETLVVEADTAAPVEILPPLTAPRRPRKLTTLDERLASGLRLVVVRKPGVPMAEVRLRLPMLSAKKGHAARAAVLSDTLLTGTERYDRAGLAAAIQALGADVGVGVDADRMVMSGNVLASNLKSFLGLLDAVLTGATHPAQEVAAEKARLVERLSIARSRAGTIAHEALARRMFGDHPYSRDLPEAADVEAVSAAQIRRMHTDWVRPDGAVLVVVGDVSPARVLDTVQTALTGWTGATRPGRVAALHAPEPGPLLLLDRPGSVQSSLRYGGPGLRRDDADFPALQLANAIFGGYFSSRWTENIREDKGYTYGPHSRLEHATLGSYLTLEAEVATEVTAPALLETLYELGRIASLPVKQEELDAVRQYVIGSMSISTATQSGLASTLSGLIGNGISPDWLTEHPKRLAQLDVETVSAAAARFLAPHRMVGVVVGDAAAISGPLGRLGEVVPTTLDAIS